MEDFDLSSTQEPPSSNTLDPTQSAISTDQTIDPDIDMAIDTNQDSANPDSVNPAAEPPIPPPRDPARKDISLRDFLAKMDDYAPIIPDAVTAHHLALAGLPPHSTPLALSRLLALATQKFIADIAADAYQYSRMRSSASGSSAPSAGVGGGAGAVAAATGLQGQSQAQTLGGTQKEEKAKSGAHMLGVQRPGLGGGGGGGGQGRAVLTMEDLGCAVGEYGVNVRRGEFYR